MKLRKKLSASIARLLPRNTFARGVSVLVGGAAGSQLLVVLAAPLLTRLYTPDDFGLLAICMGLITTISSIASLRYEGAIPLPQDDVEAANVAVLCTLAIALMTLVSAALALFANHAIANLLGAPALAKYLWLLPVGVFCLGTYQAFNYWALRHKTFTAMTDARLKQSLTATLVQLAGYKMGVVALLSGYVSGMGMGGFLMSKSALRHPAFREASLAGILKAAKRYRRFPIYSTWSGLFNTAGRELPPLLFASFFSPTAAGLYALTHRVLAMPMSIIGAAIGNVFLASATDAHRENRLAPLVMSVHDKLAHIAMPPTLVFLLAGPELFAFVFGDNWREAGVFAQWLAPWLYTTLITSPLSTLIIVLEKQRSDLAFEIILLAVRTATLVVGGLNGDLMVTVALFAAGNTLCWAGFLVWITVHSGNSAYSLIQPTMSALAWGVLCVAPLELGIVLHGRDGWIVALTVTGVLISTRYYFLLRRAYS
ncbi:oligosaccharide flippase family protein [Parapusillimonas sp. SGNA-6]|nr:oligosaccharide flippase family protein [Parapusillimonas sp. SGNA-6]